MLNSKRIAQCALFVCIIMLLAVTPVYAADVLVTVRDRAVALLRGLKPVIFILAGFGLIGFAWMAIFNQISWKWFSNIAIGLFLVANMGIFIDYFTSKSGKGDKYSSMLGRADYKDNLGAGYQATPGTGSDPLSQTPGSDEGPAGFQSSDDLGSVQEEAIKKASSENECTAVGGTWADNKCSKSSSTSGSDAATFADAASFEQELAQNKDEASCSDNGGTWYNGKCVASWNVGDNATSFTERLDCANSGGNWDGSKCVKTPTDTGTGNSLMDIANQAAMNAITSQKDANGCTTLGGVWTGTNCVVPGASNSDSIINNTPSNNSGGGTAVTPSGSGTSLQDIANQATLNAITSQKDANGCAILGGVWTGTNCVVPGASNSDSASDKNTSSGSGNSASSADLPSGAQMYDLASKLQDQYKKDGKINLSQILREEVAAGRMTAEQASQAGSIFTQVSQDKGGNIGATIKDVLKGSKEQAKEEYEAQQQAERDAFLNQQKGGTADIGVTTPGENKSGNQNQDTLSITSGEQVESMSFYACQKRGGTWTEDGKCKGAAPAKINPTRENYSDDSDDSSDFDVPDERDNGISYYGCMKMEGMVWNEATASCEKKQ